MKAQKPVEKTCPTCGKTFAGAGRKKFCSPQCKVGQRKAKTKAVGTVDEELRSAVIQILQGFRNAVNAVLDVLEEKLKEKD